MQIVFLGRPPYLTFRTVTPFFLSALRHRYHVHYLLPLDLSPPCLPLVPYIEPLWPSAVFEPNTGPTVRFPSFLRPVTDPDTDCHIRQSQPSDGLSLSLLFRFLLNTLLPTSLSRTFTQNPRFLYVCSLVQGNPLRGLHIPSFISGPSGFDQWSILLCLCILLDGIGTTSTRVSPGLDHSSKGFQIPTHDLHPKFVVERTGVRSREGKRGNTEGGLRHCLLPFLCKR